MINQEADMATATTKPAAKETVKTAAQTTQSVKTPSPMTQDAFKSTEDFTVAAQDQFRKVIDTFTGNAEDVREQTEAISDEMRTRFEKTQKHVTEVSTDLVDAAQAEMSEAVQFATDLTSAKTFADALTVQQNYWTNLFQTRIERTQEITQNAADAARETFEPMNTSLGSVFDQSKLFGSFFPTKAQ
jgi:polyhydroxyalkanoate synthesis regulator phasin